MRKVGAIALAGISDALRRKVVWAVVVFAALLAVAIPSLPSYGTGVDAAVFRDFAIALTFAASLVVAVALGVTRIPAEVERRTVFAVLSRDVSRWHYVLGTWLGIVAVMLAVEIAFLAVTLVIGWYSYGVPFWQLAEASLALWLECGIVVAFCILMTARLGAVTAAVAALAFVFVGHAASGLVTSGAEGVSTVKWLPTLETFNVINPVAHGSGVSATYALVMLAAFAGWSALLLLGGAALFQGRDL